jgi:hypothetical protein
MLRTVPIFLLDEMRTMLVSLGIAPCKSAFGA